MGKHVIVIADDLGVEGYSRTAPESGIATTFAPRTPNLDALADAGVRFRRFYVNPRCSPSRSLFYTGRYAFRTGMGNNATPAVGPPGSSESWFPLALTSHVCANIGKWHLYSTTNGNFLSPLTSANGGVAGLDRWHGVYGNIIQGLSTYWYWPRYLDGTLSDLSLAEQVIGNSDGISNRVATNYCTTINIDDAIDWIGDQSGDWVCVVATCAPHSPLHQPPTLAEREAAGYGVGSRLMSATMETVTTAYNEILGNTNVEANQAILDGLGWPSSLDTITANASYAAHISMIEAADTEIGRLLDDANVDIATNSDVTVWYISDNGASTTVIGPQGKNTVNDLGTRVPMIVAGNHVTATGGSTCDRLVDMVDIWRTLLALESVDPATAFPGVTVDGVDMSALLANPSAAGPRAFSYTEAFATTDTGNPEGLAAGALETGATGDSTYPQLASWDRAVHSDEFSLLQQNTYTSAGVRTVTHQLFNHVGGDRLNASDLLVTQELDFDSVSRDTAPWRALQELVAQLALLAP